MFDLKTSLCLCVIIAHAKVLIAEDHPLPYGSACTLALWRARVTPCMQADTFSLKLFLCPHNIVRKLNGSGPGTLLNLSG